MLDETRRRVTDEGGDCDPAGLDDRHGELCRQLCGGAELRHRRSWQRDLCAGSDRLERGVRAVCAWRWTARQGASIVLNQAAPGADIIGTVGGTEYFRISIDPVTGVVTFSQSLNVWHADTTSDDDTSTLTLANAAALQVVQTVTDADGDSEHGGDQSGRRRVPDRGRRPDDHWPVCDAAG